MTEYSWVMDANITDSSTIHIPIPDGCFLQTVSIGNDSLGASATLDFDLPFHGDERILSLAAGEADNVKTYSPSRQVFNVDGSDITGVFFHCIIIGGIDIKPGGTIANDANCPITFIGQNVRTG